MKIQIGPSSINKQALDTLMTVIFYHFLTLHGRKNSMKKYQNARSFFLSHTSKLNQQKQ